MTGQGMKNVYKELMTEASTVYFLKGAHGFKLSTLLKDIGTTYNNKGYDVEYFYDPLFDNTVEATFVHKLNLLFLQATNPSFEPTLLGTRHKVISLYDCTDDEKLSASGARLEELQHEAEIWRNNCFEALSKALRIHDDWEVENRRYMSWGNLNKQVDYLFQNLFGVIELNKAGKLTHRILGTLTPAGARDTVQSITQNLERRLFIKGYPGTGKSSLMKKLAEEALQRGFDVQMVWCGLDANSIDMVIIPELKFCIFDSTEPHKYFPDESRRGDEIFDVAQHCRLTEIEEQNIAVIVSLYRETMNNAVQYAKGYAKAVKEVREIIDDAIIESEWEKRTAGLFK